MNWLCVCVCGGVNASVLFLIEILATKMWLYCFVFCLTFLSYVRWVVAAMTDVFSLFLSRFFFIPSCELVCLFLAVPFFLKLKIVLKKNFSFLFSSHLYYWWDGGIRLRNFLVLFVFVSSIKKNIFENFFFFFFKFDSKLYFANE